VKNKSIKIITAVVPALVLMLALPALAQQATEGQSDHRGRFVPPASVTCDRNLLDSFNGEVTSYQRSDETITIIIQAEWGAFKTVTIGYVDTNSPVPYFLYQGQPFTQDDWAKIEVEPGVLMEGMSAIAWICEDGETGTMLDWQPL